MLVFAWQNQIDLVVCVKVVLVVQRFDIFQYYPSRYTNRLLQYENN